MRMVFTVSVENLPAFAQDFWKAAGECRVFLFEGEMGAGKTTMIEALCAAKGVKDRMGSPTFSIINEYRYSEGGEEKPVYHIDLYRLKDEAEIVAAGVEDCVYSGALCFVEWPQKAPRLFDESAANVAIEVCGPTERRVKLERPS